jgi:hypothetical protein
LKKLIAIAATCFGLLGCAERGSEWFLIGTEKLATPDGVLIVAEHSRTQRSGWFISGERGTEVTDRRAFGLVLALDERGQLKIRSQYES